MTPSAPSELGTSPTSFLRAPAAVRVVSILCALAIGLQLAVPVTAWTVGFGALRAFLLVLLLFALPTTYLVAGTLAAIGIGRFARHVLLTRRERKGLAPVILLGAGLAVAFGAPFGWVVALGQTGSLFWYLVYAAFLPGSLVAGAQIALLGSTVATRSPWWASLLAGVAVLPVAVGAPLLVYALLWGFVPEVVRLAGVLLASVGLGLDAAIAILSRPPAIEAGGVARA